MQVKDVMTTDLATVSPDDTVRSAIKLLLDRHVTGLPVVLDDSSLYGIFTEQDAILIAKDRSRDDILDRKLKDARVMGTSVVRSDVISVSEDTALDEAVDIMFVRKFVRLPVLRDGKLVGVCSRCDIVRGYMEPSS